MFPWNETASPVDVHDVDILSIFSVDCLRLAVFLQRLFSIPDFLVPLLALADSWCLSSSLSSTGFLGLLDSWNPLVIHLFSWAFVSSQLFYDDRTLPPPVTSSDIPTECITLQIAKSPRLGVVLVSDLFVVSGCTEYSSSWSLASWCLGRIYEHSHCLVCLVCLCIL